MTQQEIDNAAGSKKNDRKDGKPRMELIPLEVLEEVAKVFTAGAEKYGENTWQNLPNGYERYKGALLRHLTEIEKGNEIDADTGCMHIAQVVTNAIFMCHIRMRERKDRRKSENNIAKTEFKIGDVFQCGLVKLKCEKATNGCKGCIFYKKESQNDCSFIALGNCGSCYRGDRNNVIFVEVEE